MDAKATNKMNALIARADKAEEASRCIIFRHKRDRERYMKLVYRARELHEKAARIYFLAKTW